MLEIKNVTKTFNKGTVNEKIALDNISLTLNEGDFVTVIGGNGAGKSTLLNLIAGVHALDSGKIILDSDKDISLDKEYRRAKYIGRVFQDPMMGTAADMGIAENLALANKRGERRTLKFGISAAEQVLYKEKLSLLGLSLEDRLNDKVGLLSGGQRQAITLLMATLKKPKLLLLDEHTAALDPKTAENVLQLTDQLVKQDNLTAFMVTHNMQDAIDYGNRLIMMYDGKIIFDLNAQEKSALTVNDLLTMFEKAVNMKFTDDSALLINKK